MKMKFLLFFLLLNSSCYKNSGDKERKLSELQNKLEKLESDNKKMKSQIEELNILDAPKISDWKKNGLKGRVREVHTTYYYARKNGGSFIKGAKVYGETTSVKDKIENYNSKGFLVKKEFPYSQIATYQGTTKKTESTFYRYSEDGCILSKITKDYSNSYPEGNCLYKCDNNGNLVSENCDYSSFKSINTFRYNRHGYLEKMTFGSLNGDYHLYQYNNKRRLIFEKSYDNKDVLLYEFHHKYDENDFLKDLKSYDRGNNKREPIREIEYTYGNIDHNLNWTERIENHSDKGLFFAVRNFQYF